jgi:hypothetical protein
MQITFTIPEPYATYLTERADVKGISPTQWVTQLLVKELTPGGLTAQRASRHAARDAEIRKRRAQGFTYPQIAKEFDIGAQRVYIICRESE